MNISIKKNTIIMKKIDYIHYTNKHCKIYLAIEKNIMRKDKFQFMSTSG